MADFVNVPIQISAAEIAKMKLVYWVIQDLARFDPEDSAGNCLFCGVPIGCAEDGWVHPGECLWARGVRAWEGLRDGGCPSGGTKGATE